MTIYVDMDGVLADFDRGYHERFGVASNKELNNVDWNLVRVTSGFYRDLPPMPDFDELWRFVCSMEPVILTGIPSSVPGALENKREWVRKHIGSIQPIIGCRSSEKCTYAQPGDILIDDWKKYRDRWIGRGGRWITHLNAKQSVRDLGLLLSQDHKKLQKLKTDLFDS